MIAAALLGTLLLHGADAVERKLLGRRPAYDPAAMGRRLVGDARAGVALRWVYGPLLGLLQQKWRAPPLRFGAAIAAAELFALPRLGATPEVRRWGRGEVPLLFAHATAFALAVHALRRWSERRRTPVPFAARCG